MNANRVHEMAVDSMFEDSEVGADGQTLMPQLCVQGIINTFGFHPERVKKHKAELKEMIKELPEGFYESGGGGMSFLNLCEDKHGNQWAEHSTLEMFLCMAIANDLAGYCLPKEMWHLMPGGMPFVVFNDQA